MGRFKKDGVLCLFVTASALYKRLERLERILTMGIENREVAVCAIVLDKPDNAEVKD